MSRVRRFTRPHSLQILAVLAFGSALGQAVIHFANARHDLFDGLVASAVA
jgi:hypothetical protein